MSDGDDDAEEPDADEAPTDEEASTPEDESIDYELDVETFEDRLDDVATALEDAETETELDDLDQTLDAIESDLDRADLPEPDDEDEEGAEAELRDRVSGLREDVDEKRGPYAEDIVTELESVQETLRETRWTSDGETSLGEATETFVETVSDELETDLETPSGEPAELADGLTPIATAIEDAALDPDDDAETLETLLDAVETLSDAVADAEEWDDLSVREQLQAQGFYDSLKSKHKDFPPEWTAIQEWENEGNAEMILLALDAFDSDFMERHCLESLERMGPSTAIDSMLERADRRDKPAIAILGKIGEPRDDVVETLVEFVGTDSDPALQQVTMKALGEMGAEDAVQAIADRLAADNDAVRSHAARALGLIGDTRAIDPLEDVLLDDPVASVRASAAWALVQIGTEDALSIAADGVEDEAYVVQSEAEPAAVAVGEDPDPPPA